MPQQPMHQYVLDLREGYRGRTEPESVVFVLRDDDTAFKLIAESFGAELIDGKLSEEDFRAFGAKQLTRDGKVIFPPPAPAKATMH
ncbi:MAG: hypothetical protein HY432_01825 [Candidatus Liptonbacteria bacterium]|nr:hypothetical protein [Candidatus Liptonbacteria bacterium]